MEINQKKSLIKKFVISISRPLSLEENLNLIENVFKDLKSFKLEKDDYGYIWKGLFYSIWYTEMGKGCEQIVSKLYELADSKLLIYGFEQLNRDWFSIDYIRIDKYMFLTRRLTHKLLDLQFKQFVKKQFAKFNDTKMKKRAPNLLKIALNKMDGVGLVDHFLDVLFAECFKIISPFLSSNKQKELISRFLILLNRTLINQMNEKAAKDKRILKVLKIELFGLFNHLKRNKFILEQTMSNLIEKCNSSPRKEIRSIGEGLENKFNNFKLTRDQQPQILPSKVKLSYNRKKALKNKSLRLADRKKKLRKAKEAKFKEEQSQIKQISAEEQLNELIGV